MTQHNHQVVFGRKVEGCDRCEELKLGAPTRKWANYARDSQVQRLREIREHNCKTSGCGPVCTIFDW